MIIRIRIIGYAELKVRGQENLFNPLNRSAGTCFIKTYPFGMIKQIGRIYRISQVFRD